MNWVRFILACLYWIAMGQLFGQNLKPKVKPDTSRMQSINLLSNDYDPNGDRIRITRFNNLSFVKSISIIKRDTGTFYLDSGGRFSFAVQPYFFGQVNFTYYVNDGKAGAGVTGKLIFIKPKDTIRREIPSCSRQLICVRQPDCVDDTSGYYCFQIREACQLYNGCLKTKLVNGFNFYYIQYTDGILTGRIDITEEDAIFIIEHTCKR